VHGFGGCAIAIVKNSKIDKFIQNVRQIYRERCNDYCSGFYIVETGENTKMV